MMWESGEHRVRVLSRSEAALAAAETLCLWSGAQEWDTHVSVCSCGWFGWSGPAFGASGEERAMSRAGLHVAALADNLEE